MGSPETCRWINLIFGLGSLCGRGQPTVNNVVVICLSVMSVILSDLINFGWIRVAESLESLSFIECCWLSLVWQMEAALAARDVVGVEDFVLLEDYSNILAFIDNLRKRFHESLIYVSSSPNWSSCLLLSAQDICFFFSGIHAVTVSGGAPYLQFLLPFRSLNLSCPLPSIITKLKLKYCVIFPSVVFCDVHNFQMMFQFTGKLAVIVQAPQWYFLSPSAAPLESF